MIFFNWSQEIAAKIAYWYEENVMKVKNQSVIGEGGQKLPIYRWKILRNLSMNCQKILRNSLVSHEKKKKI